ncbi:MAG: hypothetical protein JRE70_21330 [Deltaproteobacteria bacterium]|nr:hypothetical protein [Deltaproteobacteria bacterium]
MPTPTFDELQSWADNYVALWNAGDKDAWAANWRKVAPGDFRMLDPVGTPEKIGFEHCCLDSFDLFQKNVKFRIQPGSLFICGNEVAWLLENHIRNGDKERVGYSIETYRFEDDGSVVIRTYYKVPAHSEGNLGEMIKTYMPEGG